MATEEVKLVTIVLCMGKPQETRRCLESLLAQPYPRSKILVIENQTTDNVKTLAPLFPEVHFLGLKKNEGFSGGNNRGIIEARARWNPDFYFLLNNDAWVEKESIPQLVECLSKDPAIGLAAPKILTDPKERQIWAAGGEFFPWTMMGRNRGLGQLDQGQYDRLESCRFLSGCALMIRKEVLERIGLLDENFFTYTEDLDLCLRARKKSFQLIYCHQSLIYHRGSVTSGGEYEPFQSFYRWRNRFLLGAKHGTFLQKLFLFNLFFPALIVKDSLRYFRLGKFESIPYLWKGLFQFLHMDGFRADVDPLDQVGKIVKVPGQRKYLGTLFRNPALIFIIKGIDFVGSRVTRRSPAQPPEDPGKILVAKIDHLGDLLLTLNILPLIQKRFPRSQLHFVCGSWGKELLEGNPYIDKILTYDHFWLNRKGSLWSRIARNVLDHVKVTIQMRKEKYDIGIDLRSYFPNFVPCFAFGKIKYTLGYATAGFGFMLDQVGHWREGLHETDHFRDLLEHLLILPEIGEVDLTYLRRNGKSAEVWDLVRRRQPFCILHPGSRNKIKFWNREEWKKLARFFGKKNFLILFTGSAEERNWVEELVEGEGTINLCGKTDLPSLAALVKQAEWVVGVDSFVPHLAAATGTKTIVIFNGIENIEQWKPVGKWVQVVTNPVHCSPCFLKHGCESMDCLKSTAKDVIEVVEKQG